MGQNIMTLQTVPSLLSRVTCPQCWHKFAPQDVLWISEHQDLFNLDNRVPNAQLRFLPSRFTPNAEALDSRGFPCHRVACPNCHLEIPRSMLEMESFFLSILGAPGSGKSYFLAAMANQLRNSLPLNFKATFSDADASLNTRLRTSEQHLFANSNPEKLQELQELIHKTQEGGDDFGYVDVNFGSQSVRYLRPFTFTMQVQDDHPNPKRRGYSRAICLYDNAGESFLPGFDRSSAPVTRHLAESRALFFVYDPLQDSRFRMLDSSLEEGIIDKSHLGSQEGVFQEAATRIRRFAGLSSREKYSRPVIVVVTKCDRWAKLADRELIQRSPIISTRMKMSDGSTAELNALDMRLIDTVSSRTRDLLLRMTPEVVTSVENFSNHVCYIPVSATGESTTVNQETGRPVIRPGDAQPTWAEIPFLYALSISSLGLIPKLKAPKGE